MVINRLLHRRDHLSSKLGRPNQAASKQAFHLYPTVDLAQAFWRTSGDKGGCTMPLYLFAHRLFLALAGSILDLQGW